MTLICRKYDKTPNYKVEHMTPGPQTELLTEWKNISIFSADDAMNSSDEVMLRNQAGKTKQKICQNINILHCQLLTAADMHDIEPIKHL